MRLLLVSDDGEVLDAVNLTAEDFADEVNCYPAGVLATLSPGSAS